MTQDNFSQVVQSSKDFADLANKLMSATTVLHNKEEEINHVMSKLAVWENAPTVGGIRCMHDAKCFYKQHMIELRHVSGQDECDIVVKYDDAQTLPQRILFL